MPPPCTLNIQPASCGKNSLCTSTLSVPAHSAPDQLQTRKPCARLQVRVPKEETALVSDLRYGWKKLRKLTTDMSDNLARLQVGAQLASASSIAWAVQPVLQARVAPALVARTRSCPSPPGHH